MDLNKQVGVALDRPLCQKIWGWTKNDVELLFQGFNVEKQKGPSNGYAIFLFCLMDIWGSIMLNSFGDETTGHSDRNVKKFLSLLVDYKPNEYKILDRQGKFTQHIVRELRHNLVHMYGLRVIKTFSKREHLNIDINSKQETINIQASDDRWHIDCKRLREDILYVIGEWLKRNR